MLNKNQPLLLRNVRSKYNHYCVENIIIIGVKPCSNKYV